MGRWIVVMVVGVAACGIAAACKSGDDKYRMGESHRSHKGTEPNYEKESASKAPEKEELVPEGKVLTGEGKILTGEDREREEGEVKVGTKWEFPVATTKQGMYWGTIEESRAGKRILAFRGIKHVQPPVGPLRFQAPLAERKFQGIREAKHNGHLCPQHLFYKPDIWVGDEDCLWVNIFTRSLVKAKRMPVVVWIHGGDFSRGSAAEYDPAYLLDSDIVLVTLQYRLGMFGFLSTEDKSAPGNYGMMDQIAGLQWVKANAEAFGGDPNSITVMGQQAGGASVHYHMLSPLTRGLFNRAVSMSGTALCWWASLKRPLERAQKLAKLVDCPQKEKEELVKCLKEKPMDALMNTHPNFYEWKHLEQNKEPVTAWSPRVDIESPVPFMPQEPMDLMTQGNFQHIPWITGITDDEGATRGSAFFADMSGVKEFEESYEKYGPLMFGFHDGQSEAPKMMAKKVKDFYWADKVLDKDVAHFLVDAISDSSYSHPVDTASKVHAIKSNADVFMYHFGYRGQHSLTQVAPNHHPPKLIAQDVQYGVGNGDELMYLFPILNGIFRPLPPDDLIFSHRMIEMLISFALTGKPKIDMGPEVPAFEWTPVNPSNISHLDIGNEMEMDAGLPNHRRMSFWQSMPVYWNADRSNYKPAPPPAPIRVEL